MRPVIKALRVTTYLLVVVLLFSYFYKDRLSKLTGISDESLRTPVQSAPKSNEKVKFEANGYTYTVTPLHDYTLTGVVVSKKNYGLFSDDGPSKTAPFDLCIVWGDNLKNNLYLSKEIKYSQDQRSCSYSYSRSFGFNSNHISNNHPVIRDSVNYRAAKQINIGDEVQITGQLVSLKAVNDSGEEFIWDSSTSREDTGNGACEVILVESIRVLNKSNPLAVTLYGVALFLLPIVILARIALHFYLTRKRSAVDDANLV